jgi:hypothetical protein
MDIMLLGNVFFSLKREKASASERMSPPEKAKNLPQKKKAKSINHSSHWIYPLVIQPLCTMKSKIRPAFVTSI